VEISADCNLDCRMCFRRTFPGPLFSMDDVVLDRVLDAVAGLEGLGRLMIAGFEEPLMHPRIGELVAAGTSAGAEVWIQSNGVFAGSRSGCGV